MHRHFLAVLLAAAALLTACSDRSAAADPVGAEPETPPAAASPAPATPAPASAAPPTATAGPGPGALAPTHPRADGGATFEGPRAMAHIQKLAQEIGPRVAGSPHERDAVAYIVSVLRAAGHSVEVQEFDFDGDPFRPATVTTPAGPRDASTMSGATGGSVTGKAVFVGLGDAAGIAGRRLDRLIAVADRGDLTFKQKYENVFAAGAVALVVVNNDDGIFTGALNTQGAIPVVGLSRADGAAVKEAANAGASLTIDAPVAARAHARNVLARPAAGARCDILVGGHYDTVPGAPGAYDNGSGTAAALELARSFATDGPTPGLCFAAFGAEESGLHGSAAMAKRMSDAGELPRFMVNIDMVGQGTKVSLIGSPELQQDADTLAQQLGIPARRETLGFAFGSDHQSFQKAGVPVLMFSADSLGKFHTPQDTVELMQADQLQQAGTLARAFVEQLLHKVARG